MDFSEMNYTQCKEVFMRLAQSVAKADTPQELCALLVADTTAPYHSFSAMYFPTVIANAADRLGMLIYDDLDDGEEVPQ